MPRLFQKRSGTWTEIRSIFQKQGGTWTEILNIFQKIGGTWTKVFAGLKVPGNTVAPTITGSGYLFGTLTNTNLGTWTNTPSSYSRQWRRGTPSAGGGEPSGYSNISGATSSTYVTTSADNNKYIICQITATNAVGNNSAASNSIYVSKYAPVSLLPYTFSGSAIVGSTITALEQIGSWKNTTSNSGDTSPDTFEYEWSWSTGEIIQSTAYNSINSNSYTIVNNDNNRQIRFRSTGTNSGGSDTSGYTTSATVTTQYSFAFGNTLYVGSNGYVGLDTGGFSAGTAGNGRNINIYNQDLVQYSLQEYSDNSNYHLFFKSYRYQNPLVASSNEALDYQIKFYTSQPYCDVYIVRKGANVPIYLNNPGYYQNGFTGTPGILGPFVLAAGSVIRIYFNGTVATTSGIGWSTISNSLWKNITTSQIDDNFTAVVTSANQQAAVLTPPTISSVTVGNQGGPVTVNYAGGSGPFYQAYWYGSATAPTGQITPDASGSSSSSLTDSTGPSTTSTQYMYVRSVSDQFEVSVGPSSLASSWSAGVAFNMISTAVTQSTTPSATATSNGSTTTVKYLDSITWSGGTYTNASSVTSVLLYSTNSDNLVSSGGNTNSSFRSTSPYAIQTSDPLGTPYKFAVRDTVVGTNGTTYYFYSNQITSANADAVAFSYNTGVGAAGGWSATVVTAQSGAFYSIPTTTGYSVNSSTGTVTVTGLGSNVSSSITVTKSVSGYNSTTASASGTSDTVTTYTLSYSANGGSSTPSQQSGVQGASITLASSAGTLSGSTFGGWTIGGTTYSAGGSYTFGSANATATAIWTAAFVAPTSPAPSWSSGSNFQRITGSSILRWYTDYPGISGDGSITGMQFQIRTTAGGGTLLADSTRVYPGAGTYPYSGGGTIWAFRCGTSDGDISYSSSARFARARVVMLGTNGTTYFGTYSGWI